MRVGVCGFGQLARMLALAGDPLGISFNFLCLSKVESTLPIPANYFELDKIDYFIESSDVITYETENIPEPVISKLKDCQETIFPSIDALERFQDRLLEKHFLNAQNIATANFCAVEAEPDLAEAEKLLSFPFILKTTTQGYDGKGQIIVNSAIEAKAAWAKLSPKPLIAEEFINFSNEYSQVSTFIKGKDAIHYPLSKNVHSNGILMHSESMPELEGSKKQVKAQNIASVVARALSYTGTLSVELFAIDDQILVNEIAPRVHNSGHWSIEGTDCSQFENHLRAISGSPIKNPACKKSYMFNLISKLPELKQILKENDCHIHLYHKDPRKNRKLGHITCTSTSAGQSIAKELNVKT